MKKYYLYKQLCGIVGDLYQLHSLMEVLDKFYSIERNENAAINNSYPIYNYIIRKYKKISYKLDKFTADNVDYL